MNSAPETVFVETGEYRRFTEFCDACRRFRYIGLCYGPPGVGKTLSARKYSRWGKVREADRWGTGHADGPILDTVFYTPPVVNSPNSIAADIKRSRDTLRDLAKRPLRHEKEEELKALQRRDEEHHKRDWLTSPIPELHPTYEEVSKEYVVKELEIGDPTTLILVDEADRLRMASLEQVRDSFDHWGIGIVLIGMPGIEKRMARYPQLYSRVGFVHEFRPLAESETRRLLRAKWRPAGVSLPADGIVDDESFAAVLRITGGNFRLLDRLLTQIARVLEINQMERVTAAVVEAARESLVIGTA